MPSYPFLSDEWLERPAESRRIRGQDGSRPPRRPYEPRRDRRPLLGR